MAGEVNFADLTLTALNHTHKRPLGEHLGDVFNVVGFGAVSGGSASTNVTAIQAAVNACHTAGGGTVYFPAGAYPTNAAINFDFDDEVGIRFLGEVAGNSNPVRIDANFNGFAFDRSLASPNNTLAMRVFENLTITNGHNTGGGVRIGSTIGAAIRGCTIVCHTSVTTEDAVGVSSTNTLIENCHIRTQGDTGSNGIIIGGGGAIIGTDMRACNVGLRAYGSGLFVGGSKFERCDTGVLLGVDSGDNDVGLNGFSMVGQTLEGHWTAIDFAGTVSGFNFSGIYVLGHPSSNAGRTPLVQDTQYGIRVRANKARNGVFQGINVGQQADVCGFEWGDSTNRANILVTGCNSPDLSPGVGWTFPTKAHTALFINNDRQPTYLFAGLPSSPLEGEEVTITNANTATWGDPVTTTGANHVVVRYNGSAWTVMGK